MHKDPEQELERDLYWNQNKVIPLAAASADLDFYVQVHIQEILELFSSKSGRHETGQIHI